MGSISSAAFGSTPDLKTIVDSLFVRGSIHFGPMGRIVGIGSQIGTPHPPSRGSVGFALR
jgi:hypothetical protein